MFARARRVMGRTCFAALERIGAVEWFDERVVRILGLSAFDRRTENATNVQWLGHDIRQNPYDIWSTQELLVERDVQIVVECGTLHGGSAFFLGTLFDLLGRGEVITIDIDPRVEVRHPRVTYLTGSSVAPDIVREVRARLDAAAPAEPLVILDSDHAEHHVLKELRTYADMVPVGGYIVVQDGAVDELPRMRSQRPGPLPAISRFLSENSDFEVDDRRSSKYLFHYSPRGFLRRIR